MAKSLVLIFTSIALAVTGQLLLKSGMAEVGRIGAGDLAYYRVMFTKAALEPRVVIGLTLYVISAVFWLVVLSRVDLSFAYPFAGLGYVVVVLVSWLALNETVGPLRWVGSVLICLGVILISRS